MKDKVPADLFTKPYTNPVGGNPQAVRNNLREAFALLREAGYEIRNTKLTNTKSGETMRVELLVQEPAFERVMLFYKPSLERVGITVSVRTIDSSQYENRLRQWDFDIVIASWGESLSPGNEQRGFWGSQAADIPGSRNLVGIKNPAVDTLIERVIFAKNRDELVAATRALDRVLLWNYYVVPQWTYGKQRTARWDRFGRPAEHAEIRAGGVSDHLVVGRGQGGQGAAAVLITRRHALVLSAGALAAAKFASPAAAQDAAKAPNATACRPSAISLIRRIFRTSNTSIRTRPRAASIRKRCRAAATTDRSSPSTRSTPTSSRARARSGWISPSPR